MGIQHGPEGNVFSSPNDGGVGVGKPVKEVKLPPTTQTVICSEDPTPRPNIQLSLGVPYRLGINLSEQVQKEEIQRGYSPINTKLAVEPKPIFPQQLLRLDLTQTGLFVENLGVGDVLVVTTPDKEGKLPFSDSDYLLKGKQSFDSEVHYENRVELKKSMSSFGRKVVLIPIGNKQVLTIELSVDLQTPDKIGAFAYTQPLTSKLEKRFAEALAARQTEK